jgi:hypothetical protein
MPPPLLPPSDEMILGSNVSQVAAVLSNVTGAQTVYSWTYIQCSSTQFAILTSGDNITCASCPLGADCASNPSAETGVVELRNIIARQGWWAPPTGNGTTFYACPIHDACLPGANGSRVVCAPGYTAVVCSVCDKGYFFKFGRCVACPTSAAVSLAQLLGILFAIVVAAGVVVRARALIPVDVCKLGLSALQILASASSVYNIPWPPAFKAFLLDLQVLLVDIVSVTKVSCTALAML